ncbi:MAG: hypothetical protein ACQERD_01350 [Campylobacterota bacterium]
MIETILNFLDIWNEKKKKIITKKDFDILYKNLSEVIKPNEVTPQKIGESPKGIRKMSIAQKNKEFKNDG